MRAVDAGEFDEAHLATSTTTDTSTVGVDPRHNGDSSGRHELPQSPRRAAHEDTTGLVRL